MRAALERVEFVVADETEWKEGFYADVRVLCSQVRSLLAEATPSGEGREPETVPLSVALQAVHLALNASRDAQARDHAVRAFQDKYGSLWPDGTLLFRAASSEGQANE